MEIDPVRSKKTIAEAIKEKEKPGYPFTPNKEIYQTLKINRKRFGLILKGKLEPTQSELSAIADYFKLNKSELI